MIDNDDVDDSNDDDRDTCRDHAFTILSDLSVSDDVNGNALIAIGWALLALSAHPYPTIPFPKEPTP